MLFDPFATATSLTAALRRKDVSSRELLDACLARIEALNPRVNAVVTLDVERARRTAAELDEAAARGQFRGPLHGLPMTVKDCFETAGLRTTCGDPSLSDYVPAADAAAVARLKCAGAVIFGKTNTPTQTLDLQTYNPIFGTTNNPWDTTRIPGGSSGGSAAAVASGFTALELGSDIGGSIRIPSHCCGVFGHKPSWGIVPERGHIPGPPGALRRRDVNVNGPIARSADDLELALNVLAGPDELDAAGWRLDLPPARHRELRHFRVAAWLDDAFCPIDRGMLAVYESAVARLRDAGTLVDGTARPPFTLEQAFAAFQPMLNGEISPITGDPTPHRDWIANDEARQRLRWQWHEFFRHYDVVLAPPLFVPAFEHQQGGNFASRTLTVDGATRPYAQGVVWSALAGGSLLPSTVMPAGPTAAGIPVGLQVIGPYLGDRTTLAFAAAASAVLGGFQRPPGF